MRIRALVAAVGVCSSMARAATPLHLAPSTPWVLNYAENSCQLTRRFGEGKDTTTLAFESEAPGFLDMVVIGKPLATTSDDVPARFLPVESGEMRGAVYETSKKGIPSILVTRVPLVPFPTNKADEAKQAAQLKHPEIRPPAASPAERAARKAERETFAAQTTAIEIDSRRNRPVILDTGSLGDAIKAFDQCIRDSLRDWGVDPDAEDRIARPVWAPDVRKWFSPDDYPKEMLMHHKESTVKVRVLVDATGHVTKCTSLSRFDEPDFNKITCAAFTARARFEPAELADGTKVPSYYVNNVVFRLAH